MSQRTVVADTLHSCVYCLKVYDDFKIIGHLNEWHILRDDVEKEIAIIQNKINKKRSAPTPTATPSSCHDQQNTKDPIMIEPEPVNPLLTIYENCSFCSSTFIGSHKKTNFYLHMKSEHPLLYQAEWEKLLKIEKSQAEAIKVKASSKNQLGESSTKRSTNSSGADKDAFTSSSNIVEVQSSLLKKTRQIFELRRNSMDVDVILLSKSSADDVIIEVPCHKIFLRTCSYFVPLLDGAPCAQLEAGEILKIEIDLEPEILEEMIRYIYTAELKIDQKNLVQLFEASLKLQLTELMIKFTKFPMGLLITEVNWLELLRLFKPEDVIGSGKFLKEIFAFLREKSSEFMNWPLFTQLTLDEVRLILSPESRVYKNAKDFQASLLKWTLGTGVYIEELSSFIFKELPVLIDISEQAELDPEDQNKNGFESDGNSDDDGTDSSNDEGSSDQPLAKRSRLSLTSKSTPVVPIQTSKSLLFCAGDNYHIYSFVEGRILQIKGSLPAVGLRDFSMVTAEGRLFILGGYDSRIPQSSFDLSGKCYSYSLAHLKMHKKVTWKNESNLIPMANFSTITLKRNLYTFGGVYNSEMEDIFYKPLHRSYKWNTSYVPWLTFNYARSQSAVAQLNENIYIVGGIGHLHPMDPARASQWVKGPGRFKPGFENIAIESVEVFNTMDNTVNSLAGLHLARCDHQVVAFQNKIFAIGGNVIKSGIKFKKQFQYKLTDSVEIFDPKTNHWTDGPSLNMPRADFAAFVLDDKMYVLGGNVEKKKDKPTMEVYDSVTNKWDLVPCGDFPSKTDFSKFVLID